MKGLFTRKQAAEVSRSPPVSQDASTSAVPPPSDSPTATKDDAGPSLASLVANGGSSFLPKPAASSCGRQLGYGFHSTALQIKDAHRSLHFYQEALGMRVVKQSDVEEDGYSMYFLGFEDEAAQGARRSSKAAGQDDARPQTHETVFGMQRGLLQLIHVHGSEHDPSFRVATGGPGFTHFSVSVPDVQAAKARMESIGVTIVEDGSSARGFAAISDPDGYHIQLISQHEGEDESLRQQLEQLLSSTSANTLLQQQAGSPTLQLPEHTNDAATSMSMHGQAEETRSRLEQALRIARGGSPVSPA